MKKGFTLAETLITLTIIGVIAALTIPNLMHKYKMKQLEIQFDKAYQSFSELNLLIKKDTDLYFNEYGLSIPTFIVQNYKNVTLSRYTWPKNFTNTTSYCPTLLDDGNFYMTEKQNQYWLNNGGQVTIDINGKQAPNRAGYDVFSFIVESGVVKPIKSGSQYGAPFTCDFKSSSETNGGTCSYWAKMNKCPDGSDKKYWDCLP